MEVYSGIPTVLAEKVWDDFVLMEHQTNSNPAFFLLIHHTLFPFAASLMIPLLS